MIKVRQLTEQERDRMITMCAYGPLHYNPLLDNSLVETGLVELWDTKKDYVEWTGVPLYGDDGNILKVWWDK